MKLLSIDDDCDGVADALDTNCAPDTARIGAVCSLDYQCGPDTVCLTTQWGFDGGYCSAWCRSDKHCAGDSFCLPLGHWGYCAGACSDRDDCRDGYDCLEVDTGRKAHAPSCRLRRSRA